MDLESIVPFETVQKDGFMMVGCVKDEMYEHGDKHGDNSASYTMKSRANVSIVHYADVVPKEDRHAMTHEICFEFCRTVPEMGFFGINNGRDCYCTPHYTAMASDSSECDAVCDGNPTTMCGGPSKSSIFAMHSCGDIGEKMEEGADALNEALEALEETTHHLKELAERGEASANFVQEVMGQSGDPDASNLCQEAKIYAGELLHAAEDAEEAMDDMHSKLDEVSNIHGLDFSKLENAKKAEKVTKEMEEGTSDAISKEDKLSELLDAIPEEEAESLEGTADQYTNIMYFVDKDFVEAPSTCKGSIIKIVFGENMDGCAAKCDDTITPEACVGFQYFGEGDGFCVLFSEFERVQYYAGCMEGEDLLQKASFLQKHKKSGPFEAKCVVKMATYNGMTLKPDKSGKCEQCLKGADKANRCYE